MSNAYLNGILFGNSSSKVDNKYIRGMEQFMLTEEWYAAHPDKPDLEPEVEVQVSAPVPVVQTERKNRLQRNSLFWEIYDLENPEEAFLGTRANAEIEHRVKVVNALNVSPKRLKNTNLKLTIEQTNALFGAMLTVKEDRLDFCVAYAVYYNKPIVVVYERSYCVFSPTVEIDLSEGDVILLVASSNRPPGASQGASQRQTKYESEKNLTQEMIDAIVRDKVQTPIKSISSYKTAELDNIAAKLGIDTNVVEGDKKKRRKKEDVYNDIRVAIHLDTTQN
jgi:hypothetical protein